MTDENDDKPSGEVIHFNPWRDFNDAPLQEDPFGIEPDADQLNVFLDVVFGYCEGLIPVRGFVDKGQGRDGKPNNIWIEADGAAFDKLKTFAAWAWREGAVLYVIPGTVAAQGQARAHEVIQMQAIVVDLDAGDILAKLAHLVRHLGTPTLVVESGGRTTEGAVKLHVWWKLTEAVTGEDLNTLCRLRGDIAMKVGGDTHFRSAHQPIRVAGSVYHKGGFQRLVQIREHSPVEMELSDFAERVAAMPFIPGVGAEPPPEGPTRPSIDAILTTPVHEGGADAWTRFEGASAAIGHFVRLVHEGRMDVARVVQKFAHAPAQLFDVKERGYLREGYFADLVLIDDEPFTVKREDVLSKVGWSPFEGRTFRSRIGATWVNGRMVWNGQHLVGTPNGQRLEFAR